MAYNEHIIGIHQPIWVRVTKELNLSLIHI